MDGFADRLDAGRRLAAALAGRVGPEALVLGLPRGGVPVAAEVARRLGLELDVLVVRKLGMPGQPELAMGAIAAGALVRNEDVLAHLRDGGRVLARVEAVEREELTRRERAYRGGRPPLDAAGREVVVVDDGLATGATMRAAVEALRVLGAGRIVVAVPVAPPQTLCALAAAADEVVCLLAPADLVAVGFWYADFAQVTDDEVRAALAGASAA